MKELQLKSDITLVALRAKSFPEGIVPAFNELEQKIGRNNGRAVYGLSQGDGNRHIVYGACVGSKAGEEPPEGCVWLIVKAGPYISEQLHNWRGREEIMSETFRKMFSSPQVILTVTVSKNIWKMEMSYAW